MFIMQVVTTSTDALGYHVNAFIYDKNGRSEQVIDHSERTNDKTFRVPAVWSDTRLVVFVKTTDPEHSASCEIFGPGHEDWGIFNVAVYQVQCEANIQAHRPPGT